MTVLRLRLELISVLKIEKLSVLQKKQLLLSATRITPLPHQLAYILLQLTKSVLMMRRKLL